MEEFQSKASLQKNLPVVLVSVLPKNNRVKRLDELENLDELESLAETAGCQVVGKIVQHLDRPNGATHLGRGKVGELSELLYKSSACTVICEQDLSPGQVKNLEDRTKARVIDRTELILDIFSQHAQTHQARLQVELARLEYILPRLKRMWTHFSRVRGGVGLRGGEGEKQIELDRRIIGRRIRDIQRELRRIRVRKKTQACRQIFSVALVGYTNAGKSSLFNRLADGSAAVADMLFKTLDTRTRLWRLPNNQQVVLSDTVGFIRDLPPHLVESFHATLEEIRQADLILHIVDASARSSGKMRAAVDHVLTQLGTSGIEKLVVYNKIDLLDAEGRTTLMTESCRPLMVSARSREGLEQLTHEVLASLRKRKELLRVGIPASEGSLLAWVREKAEIVSEQLVDGVFSITAWLGKKEAGRLRQRVPSEALTTLDGYAGESLG